MFTCTHVSSFTQVVFASVINITLEESVFNSTQVYTQIISVILLSNFKKAKKRLLI